MEVNTLRHFTAELSGRSLDATLEAHLPQYAGEIAAVLQAARAAAQEFPAELAPGAVFSLKADRKVG